MDGWMDGWMGGRMGGWMGKGVVLCVDVCDVDVCEGK